MDEDDDRSTVIVENTIQKQQTSPRSRTTEEIYEMIDNHSYGDAVRASLDKAEIADLRKKNEILMMENAKLKTHVRSTYFFFDALETFVNNLVADRIVYTKQQKKAVSDAIGQVEEIVDEDDMSEMMIQEILESESAPCLLAGYETMLRNVKDSSFLSLPHSSHHFRFMIELNKKLAMFCDEMHTFIQNSSIADEWMDIENAKFSGRI